MENNFFKINLNGISVGLSHHISNYHILLLYCYKNNLKLIKPIFTLIGKHNNNKTLISDLSEYYDLDNIYIDGNHFKLYNDSKDIKYTFNQNISGGLLRKLPMFQNLPKVQIKMPYISDIYDMANNISDKLDNDYMCIHVRRGDRITNKNIDIDTRADNIKKIIERHKPKNVYIMTNRINEIKSLSKMNNIYFYTDFEHLSKIKNNYYLFCIENAIMNLAKIRCSTFHTNKIDYYHDYLTDHPGHQ